MKNYTIDQTITGKSTNHTILLQPQTTKGWECPRCGQINAPWIAHCDCRKYTFESPIIGGSDYSDETTGSWSNIPKTCSNSCTNPNNCHTPHYTTPTRN